MVLLDVTVWVVVLRVLGIGAAVPVPTGPVPEEDSPADLVG